MGRWKERPISDKFPIMTALLLHGHGLSLHKVANTLGFSYSTTRSQLLDKGVTLQRCVTYNDVNWNDIIKQYKNGKSLASLANALGCSNTVLRNGFKKNGITIRSFREQISLDCQKKDCHVTVNESFFDKWTSEMAYLLGWIASDGNIPDNFRCFRVTSVDIDHLEKLSSLICSEPKIHIRKWKKGCKNKAAGTWSVNRRKVVDKLLELGIGPNKSLTLKMPDVPKAVLRHFIRGVFEGDGCFSFRYRKDRNNYVAPKITIASGSRQFVSKLSEAIAKEANVRECKPKKSRDGVWRLDYEAKIECQKIFEMMYHGVSMDLVLERKYSKFMDYFLAIGGEKLCS